MRAYKVTFNKRSIIYNNSQMQLFLDDLQYCEEYDKIVIKVLNLTYQQYKSLPEYEAIKGEKIIRDCITGK